jgi:hypothetical protein
MSTRLARGLWGSLGLSLAVLGGAFAAPAASGAPSVVTPEHGPARVANCPLPPRAESGYDLGQLPLLSKTLFYVRENYPQDISPRARELLLGALQAVASQDRAVVVERDSDAPPRWVTVTVNDDMHAQHR